MNRSDFDPTKDDLADPMFDVIWQAIKKHDVPHYDVPCDSLEGLAYRSTATPTWAGANGNDVMMILRPLRQIIDAKLVHARCDGHGDGQMHAIADVNAGLVDDLIAPRLRRVAKQAYDEGVEAMSHAVQLLAGAYL